MNAGLLMALAALAFLGVGIVELVLWVLSCELVRRIRRRRGAR